LGFLRQPNLRLAALLVVGLLILCSSAIAAETLAPFKTVLAARMCAEAIVDAITENNLERALHLARANSHLDDPNVQKNLDGIEIELPALIAGAGPATRVVANGTDKFTSSFVR
jgi:hypothetical protein